MRSHRIPIVFCMWVENALGSEGERGIHREIALCGIECMPWRGMLHHGTARHSIALKAHHHEDDQRPSVSIQEGRFADIASWMRREPMASGGAGEEPTDKKAEIIQYIYRLDAVRFYHNTSLRKQATQRNCYSHSFRSCLRSLLDGANAIWAVSTEPFMG
jgi:hypothetical protein